MSSSIRRMGFRERSVLRRSSDITRWNASWLKKSRSRDDSVSLPRGSLPKPAYDRYKFTTISPEICFKTECLSGILRRGKREEDDLYCSGFLDYLLVVPASVRGPVYAW